MNSAKLVRTRKLKQAQATYSTGQECRSIGEGRWAQAFPKTSFVCRGVVPGDFVFRHCAGQIKFSPTLAQKWEKTRIRLAGECLFTPHNFFNKHIRLTGQGSLRLSVGGGGGVATGCPFRCFSLFIEKPLDYAGLSQRNPSIFSFRLDSFIPPASLVSFSIFFLPLLTPTPVLCFSFY